MIEHWSSIGIRYGETDQMGYVHHSNYALYLEEARMDLLYINGIDVTKLDEEGIILPLAEIKIRYFTPLHYGDSIVIHTSLDLHTKTRLVFRYRITNQDKKLVCKAQTTMVMADKHSGKLISDCGRICEKLIMTEV
ncbi:MAG: thioesterase family protein [Bacteroidota bacterium]